MKINKQYISILLILLVVVIIPFISEKKRLETFQNQNKIEHIFWTGGYDSTFRICQATIVEKKKVQPIYVTYNLDSKNDKDFWVRKNRKQEHETMDNVRKMINKKFPHTKDLLLPTITVDKDTPDPEYTKRFLKLNLWPFKRKIHQYEGLARYAYNNKTYIDIGVLGWPRAHSKFMLFIREHIINKDGNKYLNISKTNPMHYLRFPIFGMSKPDMCKYSKEHNFDEILSSSWSCWFPKSNKPCGKCPMCRERFTCKK